MLGIELTAEPLLILLVLQNDDSVHFSCAKKSPHLIINNAAKPAAKWQVHMFLRDMCASDQARMSGGRR